jgi:hypothetical protein
MDRHEKEFARLLDKSGAALVRKSRHVIYRLPSGGNLVFPATPSTWSDSRKRVSTLKRIMRGQANASPVSEKPQPQPVELDSKRARIRQANREARPESDFRITTLDRPALGRDAQKPVRKYLIESVSDLVEAAERTESWRYLDVPGRTRALARIASSVPRFTHIKLAAVRYAVTSEKELDILKELHWFYPNRLSISEPMWAAYNRLAQRSSDWQPALVIDDPHDGTMILEVGSNELLEDQDRIFVLGLSAGPDFDYWMFTRQDIGSNRMVINHP